MSIYYDDNSPQGKKPQVRMICLAEALGLYSQEPLSKQYITQVIEVSLKIL